MEPLLWPRVKFSMRAKGFEGVSKLQWIHHMGDFTQGGEWLLKMGQFFSTVRPISLSFYLFSKHFHLLNLSKGSFYSRRENARIFFIFIFFFKFFFYCRMKTKKSMYRPWRWEAKETAWQHISHKKKLPLEKEMWFSIFFSHLQIIFLPKNFFCNKIEPWLKLEKITLKKLLSYT